ncbi:hypothetical protein RF11_11694 [Thelohanellus kitauei]|uniref:Reverse transcriptase domain-containing protein n=1 Tax=Thelohanellus kitauei TaxID=669202 RepID=A0A0C2MDW4_THEKT|nr:hypothetical protein RF11_11694 [Thelohanellus kitauei]
MFTFRNEVYRQPNGIFMGSSYSPTLAYLYLLDFDKNILSNPHVHYYARYIDDIFVIIDKGSDIDTSELEKLHLKFGETLRRDIVPFLDLVIMNLNGELQYCTYFKKLHSFNFNASK